jgi:RecA-family ATPase
VTSPKEAARYLADEAGIPQNGHQPPEYRLRTYNAADIIPRQIYWLWPQRLPLGKFAILAGDPGLGKSYLTLDIAARISLGGPWPDGARSGKASNVLIISVEDGKEDTIVPRLMSLGAALPNIHIIDSIVESDTETAGFNLQDHLLLLEEEIIRTEATLLILDPILAFTGAKKDTHKASDVRAVLAPLASMADRTMCVILAIMHMNKRSGELNSIYRITSSLDFAAAARSVQVVGKDPEDENRRILAPVKMNLSAMPSSLRYGFSSDGAFSWYGETSLQADDILQAPSQQERSALDEAIDFINDVLADGPMLSRLVLEAAREHDISEKTLRRAAKQIGVCVEQAARKTGQRGSPGWYWNMLPTFDDSDGQ